ncbi:MAG: qbdA [Bryobacterales bacterium]|nr:qbdA [Bryobacterales bacterium]
MTVGRLWPDRVDGTLPILRLGYPCVRRPLTFCSVLLVLLFTAACGRAPSNDGTANWLMYGRTDEDHRFSPLNQINEHTVAKLGLAWSRELGTTRGLEATPLVKDGIIYTTASWSVVHAIDGKTGAILWTYDPKVPRERALFYCCDAISRGVALYQGKIYVATLDGRLIALDERTGAMIWIVNTTDTEKPYSITSAPRIARGMVVIGNAGSEYGVRGYVSAYDAGTGKMAWRFYTVPGDPSLGFESGAMEAAAKTWKGEYWKTGGGGTAWEGIVYDPALDLLYFGTGNPTAWYRAIRGGGDNLYTACIVAVHASTGQLAWYFQTTPGDNWDYDATQPLVQADLRINGVSRKVIMQANKNGFFYVLDRKTGAFISGAPYVKGVTWATGLDGKGRPLEAPGVAEMKPSISSPGFDGAHNWNPMAYSPRTGLVYFPAKTGTRALHAPDAAWKYNPNNVNLGFDAKYDGPLGAEMDNLPPASGALLGWDPVRQKEVWNVKSPTVEGGGVLVANSLVFQGRADGVLAAYRATDGKELWNFDAGTGIMAPPVTYLVDGIQYVSVMVGWGGGPGLINPPGTGPVKPGFGRIISFRLDGVARLKAPLFAHKNPPQPAIRTTASPQVAHEGELLYEFNCSPCHGVNAVAGALPDLRYSSKEVVDSFEEVVMAGSRAERGMPSFNKLLNARQVRAIRAYILSRAQESSPGLPSR